MRKLLIAALLPIIVLVGCKTPEARRPISVKTGSFIDVSVERNKKLNAKEEASIKKIMAQQKKDYIASESGFWYYYNTKVEADSLKTPDFGDIVNFDYVVKDLNGSVIYSEEDIQARSYAMDKEELFTGLREGLKLMTSGETVTFLYRSQKAYGYYGDQIRRGTSIPLICEVTVHSITENEFDYSMGLLTKPLLLVLLILIGITSCKSQYPDLEDGICAEVVTNKGTLLAKLYYDKVPTTVANFISLAEGSNPLVDDAYKNKKYYNGLIFHRVMDDFIIQG